MASKNATGIVIFAQVGKRALEISLRMATIPSETSSNCERRLIAAALFCRWNCSVIFSILSEFSANAFWIACSMKTLSWPFTNSIRSPPASLIPSLISSRVSIRPACSASKEAGKASFICVTSGEIRLRSSLILRTSDATSAIIASFNRSKFSFCIMGYSNNALNALSSFSLSSVASQIKARLREYISLSSGVSALLIRAL
ncbi:hypothetical protein D3C85_1258770 [compost metagenome]